MKKDIIRQGDRVRIINPEFFIRCGYENYHAAVKERIEKEYGQKILEFIYEWEKSLITGPPILCQVKPPLVSMGSFDEFGKLNKPYSYDKIISALAYDLVGRLKKTGAERKIFTVRLEEYKDRTFPVYGSFMCMTGFYDPPWSGQDYWGEWDYRPGGLDKAKSHKILDLRGFTSDIGRKSEIYEPVDAIEVCNVEKIAVKKGGDG